MNRIQYSEVDNPNTWVNDYAVIQSIPWSEIHADTTRLGNGSFYVLLARNGAMAFDDQGTYEIYGRAWHQVSGLVLRVHDPINLRAWSP